MIKENKTLYDYPSNDLNAANEIVLKVAITKLKTLSRFVYYIQEPEPQWEDAEYENSAAWKTINPFEYVVNTAAWRERLSNDEDTPIAYKPLQAPMISFPVRWSNWNRSRKVALEPQMKEITDIANLMLEGWKDLILLLLQLATFEFIKDERASKADLMRDRVRILNEINTYEPIKVTDRSDIEQLMTFIMENQPINGSQ